MFTICIRAAIFENFENWLSCCRELFKLGGMLSIIIEERILVGTWEWYKEVLNGGLSLVSKVFLKFPFFLI